MRKNILDNFRIQIYILTMDALPITTILNLDHVLTLKLLTKQANSLPSYLQSPLLNYPTDRST